MMITRQKERWKGRGRWTRVAKGRREEKRGEERKRIKKRRTKGREEEEKQ